MQESKHLKSLHIFEDISGEGEPPEPVRWSLKIVFVAKTLAVCVPEGCPDAVPVLLGKLTGHVTGTLQVRLQVRLQVTN